MARRTEVHPYFVGNYTPIYTILSSHPCNFEGIVPDEFLGDQYVRNGSNPLEHSGQREIHWFDGDGMLTGVFFKRIPEKPGVQPVFSNEYILTDIHCATVKNRMLYPVMPSMTTLVNPVPSIYRILSGVLKAHLVIFSSLLRLVGRPIKRVGPANTNILYHDGRILATNEIGPPMRVFLPSLKTVGWFTGSTAEGELGTQDSKQPIFGGPGIEGFYKEMTTAHPRVDPRTGEMILFHSTFLPPFIQYSIVPAGSSPEKPPRLNQPVPGLSSGKLMHDFGVSNHYTVMIDCPVTLDPYRFANGGSAVEYNPDGRTQIGVFPR